MRGAVAVVVLALSCTVGTPFADAAQITDVSPAAGPTAGGTSITIAGTGFSAADNFVVVGGRLCPIVTETPNVIECTLPAGTGASRPIRVIDSGGQASPPFPFGYEPPEITDITAASMPTAGGTLLTITGTNFGSLDADHLVLVGGLDLFRECSGIRVETETVSVTCKLPAGQGTNVPVDITVDGQKSPASHLSYDPPTITAVTPARAAALGGTPLTVYGHDFGVTSSVTVGGSSCPIEEQGHSQLTCVLPPSNGAPPSVVVTAGGQSSNQGPFSYQLVASKCDAAKWKSASSLAQCIGKAESTGAQKGLPPDATALGKCTEKFTASCTKAETKNTDCSQVGTCAALASATSCCRPRGWDGTIKGNLY